VPGIFRHISLSGFHEKPYKRRAVFGILAPIFARLSFLKKIMGRKSLRGKGPDLSPKQVARGAVRGEGSLRGCASVEALPVDQLLERCARRPSDEAAWEEFVRRYHSTIRANVVKTFKRKVREEVERGAQFPVDLIDDLMQSVYMRLVEEGSRAIQSFEGVHDNSIFQYLAMIAINVVRDYFREAKAKKRPKQTYSLDELLEKGGDGVLNKSLTSQLDGTPATSPAPLVTRDELDRALENAVSDRHRDRDLLIFKLRYYEGLTLSEITTALGLDLSPVSVGSILNRIAVKLKSILERSNEDQ
jgi:RNA polymerase sigma factor (sigma-70 family)